MADGIPNNAPTEEQRAGTLMPIPLERFNGTDSWFNEARYYPHFIFYVRGTPVEARFLNGDVQVYPAVSRQTLGEKRRTESLLTYLDRFSWFMIRRRNYDDETVDVKFLVAVHGGRFMLTKHNNEEPYDAQRSEKIANFDLETWAEVETFVSALRDVYNNGSVQSRTPGSEALIRLQAFEAQYGDGRFIENIVVFKNEEIREESIRTRQRLIQFRFASSANRRLGENLEDDAPMGEEPVQAAPAAGAGDEHVDVETLNTLIQGGLIPPDMMNTMDEDEDEDGDNEPLSPLQRQSELG
jgi:hypothetical protein